MAKKGQKTGYQSKQEKIQAKKKIGIWGKKLEEAEGKRVNTGLGRARRTRKARSLVWGAKRRKQQLNQGS
jgi:hypothetical protein